MKKQNIILLVGAAAVAAYFLFKGKGASILPGGAITPEVGGDEKDKTDATIDADKQKLSIPEAIEAAKIVAEKIKDVKIDIKKGGKTITVRGGKKKKGTAGIKVSKTRKGRRSTKVVKAAKTAASQAVSYVSAPGTPEIGRAHV